MESSGRRRVTLDDVAQRAGVHKSTVSRALRSASSDPRVARIREVAEELGWTPDLIAAGLRNQQMRSIGVLVPRLTDVVLATIFEGIDDTLSQQGWQAVVVSTWDEPEVQRRRARLLLGHRVDGLIVADARDDEPYMVDIAGRGVPVLLVNRSYPGFVSVTCDDELGGRLAAEHLVGLGHTRLGVVAGMPYAVSLSNRVRGFRAAARERGVEVSDDLVVPSTIYPSAGREAGTRLLDLPDPPTAFFVVNDAAAIGLLGLLRERGLTPGVDVSVVGFNDIPEAAELHVPLTTVRNPMREMGALAANEALRMISGQPVTSRTLRPELVVRASTGPR
ncbi:substrate-binding domain-containing protein [Lentzea sp. NBRC 105346]|uniref:LacI family DNA-binding transcriptional regulator n=1 Tax=Lentzea sp. NBRC 105346 TaxID=3032205 RepID=UPI0025578D8A|nr:substrate-binding domain-containing protein [Lentzea sp. NBRC 105346]